MREWIKRLREKGRKRRGRKKKGEVDEERMTSKKNQ